MKRRTTLGVLAVLVGAGALTAMRLSISARQSIAPVASTTPTATAERPAESRERRFAMDVSSTAGAPGEGFAAQVVAFRQRLGANATPDAIMAALQQLARTDAGLAIELAAALGQTSAERTAWVTDLAKTWTATSPRDAWQWMAQMDTNRLQSFADGTVGEVIISTMAQHSPALLLQNLDALIRQPESSLGVPGVVAVHLGLDALANSGGENLAIARQTVERWATDSANPRLGESAYIAVASALGKSSPNEAAAWLLSLPPSPDRDTAVAEFPAHWAQHQPREAMEWVERSAPPEQKAAALQRTFSEWVERDAASAGEWLAGYLGRAPQSRDTDRLIGDVVNLSSALESNPRVALQWATLASDARSREALEDRIVSRWARADRTAALAYVNANPALSPDRRQALVTKLNTGFPPP